MLLEPPGVAARVSHVSEYCGLWAIQEIPFRAAVQQFTRIDLRAHIEAAGDQQRRFNSAGYSLLDGVAVIDIDGHMMKFVSSLSGGTSTVEARRQIRHAVANKSVKSIVLRIDSPGGTVSGTQDLADDVHDAGKQKPLFAYIEDLAASAAYWVASQARQIFANGTALVGSIGAFAVLEDASKEAEQFGVKVHVLRAGTFKGAGVWGTEVTEAQLSEMQRLVDGVAEHFLTAVSTGRKLPIAIVRGLADGRVHIGAQARALGLIDGVETFEQTVSRARGS